MIADRFGEAAQRLIEELGDEEPPTRVAFDRVGDRWSLLILSVLNSRGPQRYTELQQIIPDLSQRMLSFTLRSLERDGLVIRTAFPGMPPRVEYTITEVGDALLVAMENLVHWGLEHHATIRNARERFDRGT